MGSSLGRRTSDIGQLSQCGSSLGFEHRTPIEPTIYKASNLTGLKESHRSTTAMATSFIGVTRSSSLGYTSPAGTVEGVERVLFPAGDLTPLVMK